MDSEQGAVCRQEEHSFKILMTVAGIVITMILGLVSVTYSNLTTELHSKATKESVQAIQEKIEVQLSAQSADLAEIKGSMTRVENRVMFRYSVPPGKD